MSGFANLAVFRCISRFAVPYWMPTQQQQLPAVKHSLQIIISALSTVPILALIRVSHGYCSNCKTRRFIPGPQHRL
jgi:hypothetical protein